MRFTRAWAVAGAALVLSVPAVAQAQTSLTSTTTGAYSYNWDNNNAFNVKAADTAADNHSVYAEFSYHCYNEGISIVMRLTNHNGAGTSTSAGPYPGCPTYKHRAGVDRTLQTDLLGPWKYPQ